VAKWPENLKASRAGKLMMWGVGWSAAAPDGDTFLALGYGPNKGQANHSRFDLPEFNRLYEKQRLLPDTPERAAAMAEAKKLMIAYMPYKIHVHRISTDLAHPGSRATTATSSCASSGSTSTSIRRCRPRRRDDEHRRATQDAPRRRLWCRRYSPHGGLGSARRRRHHECRGARLDQLPCEGSRMGQREVVS
jgi:hypothetical protein